MAAAALIYILMLVKGEETLKVDEAAQDALINPAMGLSYIALLIAAILSVGFALYQIATHPKQAKGALIGIGGLAVVFLLGYLLASDEVTEDMANLSIEVTERTSKMVGAGLMTFYILTLGAILAVVLSSVRRMIKS
jgi:hypothetical protein